MADSDKQEARQAAADVAAGKIDDDAEALAGVRMTHVRANAGVLGLHYGQEADVPYDDSEVRALLANGVIEHVES